MKKTLIILVIILGLLLLIPAISYLSWFFQEKKPIGMIILDKTVPNMERLHHKSLMWVLTNERFTKKKGAVIHSEKIISDFIPPDL